MKKIEELTMELVTELKTRNNEKIEAINNIVLPLVDRRYGAGGWNEWGLRFILDSGIDPLYVEFTTVITKRENCFRTDKENGLTDNDIRNNESDTALMYEAIRYLDRNGKLDNFIEYLVSEAIPCFLGGGNPRIFFL